MPGLELARHLNLHSRQDRRLLQQTPCVYACVLFRVPGLLGSKRRVESIRDQGYERLLLRSKLLM